MSYLDDLMASCRQTEEYFAAMKKQDLLNQRKWDYRFLELARLVSTWSKDESTKCGAVIVGPDRDVISIGYNGFARNTDDSPERYADRDRKMASVVHAEENAILFGDRDRLRGATLYTFPFHSCAKCSGPVIQSGIIRCVAPPTPPDKLERWGENLALAEKDFEDAGVKLDIVPLE